MSIIQIVPRPVSNPASKILWIRIATASGRNMTIIAGSESFMLMKNRIINQQNVFAPEFEFNGTQLASNRFLALRLTRHDEGSADISVFH